MKRFFLPAVLLSVLLALTSCGGRVKTDSAAAFPAEEILLTVPFAPGGSAGFTAEAIAGGLAKSLGVPVTIDYIEGENGALGASAVAHGADDVSRVLLGSTGTLVILPCRGLSDYAAADLRPIAGIAEFPSVLAVPADSEFQTLSDLADAMRDRPGEVHIGSAGLGGIDHIAAACFCEANGLSPLHISYDDPRHAVWDLLEGSLPVLCVANVSVLVPALDGRVRVLGVFADERLSMLPDVPTVAEAGGGEGLEFGIRYGLFLPADADDRTAAALERAAAQTLEDETVRALLRDSLAEPFYRSAEDYAKRLAADRQCCETGLRALGLLT